MKHLFVFVILLFTLGAMVGCGERGNSSSNIDSKIIVENEIAYLVDSLVSGVEYSCGNKIKGIVDKDGAFEFNKSCNIEFKIGNIIIGEISGAMVNEDKRVYPADLAKVSRTNVTDKRVKNIIRVFQTLDNDNNPDNNIVITEDIQKALGSVEKIDLRDVNLKIDKLESIFRLIGKTLISEQDALEHYKSTLKNDLDIDTFISTLPVADPTMYLSASLEENITSSRVISTIPTRYLTKEGIGKIVLVGVGAESFEALTNGDISVADGVNLDYEQQNSYKLTATIFSTNGDKSSVLLNIFVLDVDENIPVIESFIASIEENSTAGSLVGNIKIIDNGNAAITKMTLSGEGSDNFIVSKEGIINVAYGANFDFETKFVYYLTLIATNQVGDSKAVDVTINIDDTVEVPVLTDFVGSVAENSPAGTGVGIIDIADGGTAIINIILSGTGSSNFSVGTDGAIVVALGANLDYETIPIYNLTSIATNSVGNSAIKSVVISVTDVAEVPLNISKVIAFDGASNDNFGESVAVSGNYIVIGARNDDDNGSSSGSAYIYKKQANGTSIQIQKLTASDAASGDQFGKGVSISGNYVVIGAYLNDDNGTDSGSAYIFKNNGSDIFTEIQKLTASNATGNDKFAEAVSIDGNYVVVGSQNADIFGYDSGSAYIFKNVSDVFTEVQKLIASDINIGDNFGYSVGISGNYVVVGSHLSDTNGTDSGSTYIYKNNGSDNYIEIQKLTSSDATPSDNFGYSVGISDDYVVVGAINNDDNGSDSGSVYIFKNSVSDIYTEIKKLTSSDAAAYDNFGYSVGVSGDNIIASASGKNTFTGASYIFNNNGSDIFSEVKKIVALDGATNDFFGKSVSISGSNVVIGAPEDDDIGGDSGSAYLISLTPEARPYLVNLFDSTISVVQGTTFVRDYFSKSINGTPITYALSGIDASHFSIAGGGILTFDIPPIYATPIDSNNDNNYSINVVVTDQAAVNYTYPLSVLVVP